MARSSSQTPPTDIAVLRRTAREHAEQGAVTPGYSANRGVVIAMLNSALATEMVCMLRYRRHHYMARGLAAAQVAAEFLAHADEELAHADRLAARIVQLNGAPDFAPDGLSARSHAEYIEGRDLAHMLFENLVAERVAIDSYRQLIAYLGTDDPTTRGLIESILAVEERHADEMADLFAAHQPGLSTAPTTAPTPPSPPPAPTPADHGQDPDILSDDLSVSSPTPGGRIR